jgi:hypothetical protein
MNWKVFTIVFVSVASIFIPQNIIGCGPDADPYDYYTSFYYQNLSDAKGYNPFYYTSYRFLYDEQEPVNQSDLLAQEWATYSNASKKDCNLFVNNYSFASVKNFYYAIEKNKPQNIPDSIKQNSFTKYFILQKDVEALGYILFAKQVQPYVSESESVWDAVQRDSLTMNKLIKNGQQLFAAAKKDFFKNKYAYQILRLAHYSRNYNAVIKMYDEFLPILAANNVLTPLCLALKAGALYKTKQFKEAAYLFSKSFASTTAKRVSNFLSFQWSIGYNIYERPDKLNKEEYLSLCKNNAETANMLAMFSFNSMEDEVPNMKKVFDLNPGAEALEIMAIREINKQEEKYFTPLLQKENGGKSFYYYYDWQERGQDSTLLQRSKEVKILTSFLHNIAANNATKNKSLFEAGAAYCAYMNKDFALAKNYITSAQNMQPSEKVKNQLALTNLLITISEAKKIDANFEIQILPSIQWLQRKAQTEKPTNVFYNTVKNEWQIFYRNLMAEILAKRYHQQGEIEKEALCIGNADWMTSYNYNETNKYLYSNAKNFLQTEMISTSVLKLYMLFENKNVNSFEKYLLGNNVLNKSKVADFAGTAYLRDFDYANAILWLKKSSDNKIIKKNPFADLLYDNETELATDKKLMTTKLSFAQEMFRLQNLLVTDKNNTASTLYKIANGLYNTTYYGYTWELVQYFRSSSDGYYIPNDANNFKKEYYGAYKAHDYFKKAFEASANKEFKAKCLFMMAKCSQKQQQQPQYSNFGSKYDLYDTAYKNYFISFKYNTYFPQLVKEYADTEFYKDVLFECSYLSDFVNKK